MYYRVKYVKTSLAFDSDVQRIWMESPRMIGRPDKLEISGSMVTKAVFGLGAMATLGCGIEWGGGSFWVIAPFKRDQRSAEELVRALGQMNGMRPMARDELQSFTFGFTRRPAPRREPAGRPEQPLSAPVIPVAPERDGWYRDPTARHQLRFATKSEWTSHVSDGGVQTTDPL